MAKNPNKLNQLLRKPIKSYEKFHQKTKIKKISHAPDDQSKWPKSWMTIFFKEYPRLDKVILPEPELNDISLKDALFKRSSFKNYSNVPLSLEQISTLLFYSCGLRDSNPPYHGKRTYPSAGARYPLEIYLISQKSELSIGIYHYNVRSHSLETLIRFEKFNADKYFNQEYVKKSSIIILITAVFSRNTMKYGDRGYRHVISEAGHIGQNIWLLASALEIGVCGVGGYPDDKLNELLDLDKILESVIYVITVGSKKT